MSTDLQPAAGIDRQSNTAPQLPDRWEPLTRCSLPDTVSSLRHQWFELRTGNPDYQHLSGCFSKRGARVLVNPARHAEAQSRLAYMPPNPKGGRK